MHGRGQFARGNGSGGYEGESGGSTVARSKEMVASAGEALQMVWRRTKRGCTEILCWCSQDIAALSEEAEGRVLGIKCWARDLALPIMVCERMKKREGHCICGKYDCLGDSTLESLAGKNIYPSAGRGHE